MGVYLKGVVMKNGISATFLLSWIATLTIAQESGFAGNIPPSLDYYTVPAISSVKRLPNTFPEDGELGGTLQIVAARNEFEPASFVVFSPQDADKAELKASDLTGDAGTIPAANVDLKIVKCWYQGGTAWYSYFADVTGREMVPELLLNDEKLIRVDTATRDNYLRVDYPDGPDYRWISNRLSVNIPFNAETTPVADAKTIQPFTLKAGRFKQFWVTVKVPADAEAGIYCGSITLSPADMSIPIVVRVLPFELPTPMTNYDETREFYTMFYNGPGYKDILRSNGSDKNHADRKMLALYENMRDHNIRHPRLDDFYPETRNQFIRQLEILRDSGCSTDPLFGAIRAFSPQWMNTVKGVPMAKQKLPQSFIGMIDPPHEIIESMFGHTNVYCFGYDEPAEWRVHTERLLWKYIHDKGLKIYSTGKDSHLRYAGYNEDFINCPGEPTRERASKWHAMGCRITNYAAPHTGPENPDFMRRIHGLQLFHANYDGIGNYKLTCYNWNDFLGEKYNFRRFNMTYPTQEDVIDTIAWEGVREAVDDVRYATKLKSLALRAIATDKTDNIYTGRQALQWVDTLDMKSVDLNTTRLEMVNRILALSEFEDKSSISKPQISKSVTRREDASVAKELVVTGKKAKAELKGAKKWKAVLSDKNIPAKQYQEATFKLIESLAVKGDMDDVFATAKAAALDNRLALADHFTAKLICAGIKVSNNVIQLKEKAAQAAATFAKSDLPSDVKVSAFNNAAKIFMATRQYALVREFSSLAGALYIDEPGEIYECQYVDNAPSSVEGWIATDILKNPKNRESRFEPYNRKAAELLVVDVNAERAVGDAKTVTEKGTAFYMAYDSDGWSMFIDCEDSEAEKVTTGLLSGGSLEMFFAPGAGECYYQWFVRPGSDKNSTAQWSPPFRHYRPMDSYWASDVDIIDNGFGVHVFIPWELVYDKLPVNGETWPFNIIRWSRAGGVTWRGKVHDIHNFGVVRWNGLTPETLLTIKRKIVMKGLAKYRKAKNVAIAHWSDEVLGDPKFYNQALLPAVERLDEMEKKATGTMTSDDVTTIYEEAVSDWMEFNYLVEELRREYLEKYLLGDTISSVKKVEQAETIHLFNGEDFSNFYIFLKDRGRNNDPKKVFTVEDGVIRISGEEWGCLTTNQEYDNYHLIAEFKWGDMTFGPRQDKALDSGILLHSVGEDGSVAGVWISSIEVQMIEGGTGDLLAVSDEWDKFTLTCPVAEEKQGQFYVYQPDGKPQTVYGDISGSGRVNWWGRDPQWKDVKGFRGEKDVEKPLGQWNRLEIIVKGQTIRVILNGIQVNYCIDVRPRKGKIQIQSEGAEVFIRRFDLIKLVD